MDFLIIFFIIVSIILFILFINLIKGIFKIAITFIFIILLIFLSFGLLVYLDARDIIQNTNNNTNIYLLKDDNQIITGFTMHQLNLSTAKSLSKREITKLESLYEKKDYTNLKGKNYKLIIIDRKAFPKTEDFDPDKIINSINDESQLKFIQSIVQDNYSDPKAIAFTMLISLSLRKDPLFLIKEYKKGNIILYEENLSFKMIKFFIKKEKIEPSKK
ncbi:MAG: hypothetical protein QXE31_02435 [Candidatus Woesearchaeota archaeon]